MNDVADRIPDAELGERLRLARETVKLRQEDAARQIGVARTTVVAIEAGQRRVRLDELQILAAHYRTSVNALLRREAVHLDLVPRFRRLRSGHATAVYDASKLLSDLVSAEVELENALGVKRVQAYPPERPILPGDVESQAEQDAQEVRSWLGLGPGPLRGLLPLLELQLGVRLFVRPLDQSVSGLFAFDERAGACMLLNSRHSQERLLQSALHELAHLIATRQALEVIIDDAAVGSREERYASCFARCFSMPARSLRQRFQDLTAGQSHLTRRHVILLADLFGVSREAMVRRLEELTLARAGTWDWFQANGGIPGELVRQAVREEGRALPSDWSEVEGGASRLALMAREVWKRGLYSEGQLAQLLRVDRYQMRVLLDGAEAEAGEADDQVKLAR